MTFGELKNRIFNSVGIAKKTSYRGFLFVYYGINSFSVFHFVNGNETKWIADYGDEDFDNDESVDDFIQSFHRGIVKTPKYV